MQANGYARGPSTPSLPVGAPANPAQPRQAMPQAQPQAPPSKQGYAATTRPPGANSAAANGQAGAARYVR